MAVIMVLINSVGRVSIVNHVHNPQQATTEATQGRKGYRAGSNPRREGTGQEGDQGGYVVLRMAGWRCGGRIIVGV